MKTVVNGAAALIAYNIETELEYTRLGLKPVSLNLVAGPGIFGAYATTESQLSSLWAGSAYKRAVAEELEDGGLSITLKNYPILVVTTFPGLKIWRNVCICKSECTDNSCKLVRIYEGGIYDPLSLESVVVVSYDCLCSHMHALGSCRWRVVVLEHCDRLEIPYSSVSESLLSLECADWVSVSHQSETQPTWKLIHAAALRRLHGKQELTINSSIFFNNVHPGCGYKCSVPSNEATDEVLRILWTGRGSLDSTKPVKENNLWIVRVSADAVDTRRLQLLRTLATNDQERLQIERSFFNCPQKITDLRKNFACDSCGRKCDENDECAMICCNTWFHESCFNLEVAAEPGKCPSCKTPMDSSESARDKWVRWKDDTWFIDPLPEGTVHDWEQPNTWKSVYDHICSRCSDPTIYDFCLLSEGNTRFNVSSARRDSRRIFTNHICKDVQCTLWFVNDDTQLDLYEEFEEENNVIVVFCADGHDQLKHLEPLIPTPRKHRLHF